MTQEEVILNKIEQLGGAINTFDLMALHISQYQARLKSLREKLALKGWILTEGEPVFNRKRCFVYRLIKEPRQLSLPMEGAA